MIRLVVIFFRQVQTNKRDEKYHQFIFTCAFVCHTHPVAAALDLRKWLVVESGHSRWTRFQTERPSGYGFIICWGQQLCLSVPPNATSVISLYLTVSTYMQRKRLLLLANISIKV